MFSTSYNIAKDSINFALILEELEKETTLPDPEGIAFSSDGLSLVLTFEEELSSEQTTTLDALIAAHDPQVLEELKVQRRKEIDKRTTEIVSEGFEFAGITFSASVEAQARIMACVIAGANAPFPIRWMSKDDTTYFDVTDVEMMAAFYSTGLGTLKAKIDLGTNLKIQINAANSVEAVNSIEDPR